MLDHIVGNHNTCKKHYQGSASKTKPVWLTVVFVFVVLSKSVNHTVFLFSVDVVLWISQFAPNWRKMKVWAKNLMKNKKRVETILQVLQIASLVCCIGIVLRDMKCHYVYSKRLTSKNGTSVTIIQLALILSPEDSYEWFTEPPFPIRIFKTGLVFENTWSFSRPESRLATRLWQPNLNPIVDFYKFTAKLNRDNLKRQNLYESFVTKLVSQRQCEKLHLEPLS